MIEESLREVATGKGALAGLDHHQTREPRESCCARQVLIPTHISQHLHQTTTHEKRMKVFFGSSFAQGGCGGPIQPCGGRWMTVALFAPNPAS